MELYKLIGKLTKWALLLQEYHFGVIHRTRITNLDAYGLSWYPNPLDEDLTGARWHEDCDQEVVPGWYVATYLTLFSSVVVEVPIQGSDDETDRPQAIANIWEDLPILYKL